MSKYALSRMSDRLYTARSQIMNCCLVVTLTHPGKGITPRVFQVFSADERMISSKEMSEKIRGELAVDIKLDEVYASASEFSSIG
jgi:hypothetical protein